MRKRLLDSLVGAGWLALLPGMVPSAVCSELPEEGPKLEAVASGVYVYRGPHAQASPSNLGAFANAGVVIGDSSVAIVDTGGSFEFGRRFREAVRGLTPLPIRYVINTHGHPDHIFGNAAFESDAPDFVGHHKLARAMAARGSHYLSSFARLVGPRFVGTRIVPPTLTVADALEIDLGNRVLRLRAYSTAHTDNDLSVFDARTGILFAGDLVFLERTPVVDGNLKGWLALLQTWRDLDVDRVVPGPGPVSAPWPAALDGQERYLHVLLAEVREVVARGGTIQQATQTVGRQESERWLLFRDNHPRNVTTTFAEVEWE